MSLRPLSPELSKIAAEELGEVPERTPQDIQAIKEWLAKQSHMNARTDDAWLLAFLRGCKFSLERTKEKLDNYYSVKSLIPEIRNGIDPLDPKLQKLINAGVCLPLPKLASPNSPRYILNRMGGVDVKEFDPMDVMKLMLIISNIQMLEDDNAVVVGTAVISDAKDLGASHLAFMTPVNIKKMVMTRQEAMPVRQKGIHHINFPSGLEAIISLVKTFLNEKNRNRFRVHGSIEELYKYVPKEIMPTEYGGDGGSIQEITDYWKKKTMEYRQWFLEDIQYKTDESKRPGKPKTAEGLFGVEGSFRQLNVD